MPQNEPIDMDSDDQVGVILPSGAAYYVYPREVGHFQRLVRQYKNQITLDNVSDLNDLDRIVQCETLLWRWNIWASQGKNYWGEMITEASLAKTMKDQSSELRQLKESIGIDRGTRLREHGNDSVSKRWDDLCNRALKFEIARDKQKDAFLLMAHEILAKATRVINSDKEEQDEYSSTPEDFVHWVNTEFRAKFEEADVELRKEQKDWLVDE